MKNIFVIILLFISVSASAQTKTMVGHGATDLGNFTLSHRVGSDTGWRFNRASGFKINSTLSLNKDSTGMAFTTGARWLLVIDTSNNRVQRVSFSTITSTGTYTPTLTNGLNVDASSVSGTDLHYERNGNQVTVWGTLLIDPTAASTLTGVDISLPIASALANSYELSGICSSPSTGGSFGGIQANVGNDRAQLEFINGTATTSTTYCIRFSYIVL